MASLSETLHIAEQDSSRWTYLWKTWALGSGSQARQSSLTEVPRWEGKPLLSRTRVLRGNRSMSITNSFSQWHSFLHTSQELHRLRRFSYEDLRIEGKCCRSPLPPAP